MGNSVRSKCKKCKGTGVYPPFKMDSKNICSDCEGTGVQLHTIIEEQFDDAMEAEHLRLYPGDIGYISFEEEDYEL